MALIFTSGCVKQSFLAWDALQYKPSTAFSCVSSRNDLTSNDCSWILPLACPRTTRGSLQVHLGGGGRPLESPSSCPGQVQDVQHSVVCLSPVGQLRGKLHCIYRFRSRCPPWPGSGDALFSFQILQISFPESPLSSASVDYIYGI